MKVNLELEIKTIIIERAHEAITIVVTIYPISLAIPTPSVDTKFSISWADQKNPKLEGVIDQLVELIKEELKS